MNQVHYSICPSECPRLRDFTQYILFTVLIKSVNKKIKKHTYGTLHSVTNIYLVVAPSSFVNRDSGRGLSGSRALMRWHAYTCIWNMYSSTEARARLLECHDRLNNPREICETDQLRHYRKRATITAVPGARADVEASIGLCRLGVVWKVRVPRPDTRPLSLKKRKTLFWF